MTGPPPPRIGALLLFVWQWVREETFDGVRAAGYGDVTSAHVALMRQRTDGLRPVDIAGRMHITRQSVHELITYMERRGYLAREADQSDRRARVVRLTATGRQLELEIRAQARRAEAHIAAVLGDRRFIQLRDGLLELAEEIGAATRCAAGPWRVRAAGDCGESLQRVGDRHAIEGVDELL